MQTCNTEHFKACLASFHAIQAILWHVTCQRSAWMKWKDAKHAFIIIIIIHYRPPQEQDMLLTEQRNDFVRQAHEIEHKYEKKMRALRDELDLRRKTEIHEIEERKNGQINTLMKNHEKAFSDIKNYYNDITLNNLALINTLKVWAFIPTSTWGRCFWPDAFRHPWSPCSSLHTHIFFISSHDLLIPLWSSYTASLAEWLRAWDTLTMFEATVCGTSWVLSPTGAI